MVTFAEYLPVVQPLLQAPEVQSSLGSPEEDVRDIKDITGQILIFDLLTSLCCTIGKH